MAKMFKTTNEVYYRPVDSAPVYVCGKGVELEWDLAVRLGLVKNEKPAAVKARKVDDIENKAVKPAGAGTKSVKE